MRFIETPLGGAFVIEVERFEDDRGWFGRTFDRHAFAERGLATAVEQGSVSVNHARHTLRGMHYQAAPHQEIKLVRCVAGAVFDVIVDLRPGSPTYRRWYGHTLAAESMTALYIPGDFAHGFLTLTPNAVVAYQMDVAYAPASGRGVRWNDPAFGIAWPAAPEVIGDRDASYPLVSESDHG